MPNLSDKKLLTVKEVIAAIVFLLGCAGTWYSTKLSTQAQFASFKEELHIFIAEEKAVNKVAAKDIEQIKVDQQQDRNRANELEKKILWMMATMPEPVKIKEQ